MEDKDIFDIVGKVLSGEASKDELLVLHRWMEESKDNASAFERMKLVWDATHVAQKISNEDRVFNKIQEKKAFLERFNSEEAPAKPDNAYREERSYTKFIVAAAACLLLVISIPVFFNINKETETVTVSRSLTHKENARGQKSKVVLSDGTTVWLNSSSKLSYINGFTDSLREVYLEGEAYFEVAKNKNKPFVVHSGKLRTTVVGTAFNVRHYPSDSFPSLFLAEGKVNYSHDYGLQGAGTLLPGNGVKWDEDRKRMIEFSDKAANWNAWKDGVLLFNDLDFLAALAECERWYDVDFIINGTPPAQWKFTGKFQNAYLKSVLNSMQYGKAFDYKIEGKNILITIK
ncbi:FecR domain-containing protein [Echinicola sediminis]